MLYDSFQRLYLLLRAGYYRRIAGEVGTGRADLSATECFCLEILMLMDRPTVSRLAAFLELSKPSTSYRVAQLVAKGYVRKTPSPFDRRETLLIVTDKYAAFYGSDNPAIKRIIQTVDESFTGEEIALLTGMMDRISAIIRTIDETGETND